MTGNTDIENEYRAEFAVGEHSARHLRRILRLYLTGAGLWKWPTRPNWR